MSCWEFRPTRGGFRPPIPVDSLASVETERRGLGREGEGHRGHERACGDFMGLPLLRKLLCGIIKLTSVIRVRVTCVQKEVGKRSSITFSFFGAVLVTFSDTSVIFSVTFFPNSFCRTPLPSISPLSHAPAISTAIKLQAQHTSRYTVRRDGKDAKFATLLLMQTNGSVPTTSTPDHHTSTQGCGTNGRPLVIQVGVVYLNFNQQEVIHLHKRRDTNGQCVSRLLSCDTPEYQSLPTTNVARHSQILHNFKQKVAQTFLSCL